MWLLTRKSIKWLALVFSQVRTDALPSHDRIAIIHIQPIRTADSLIFAVRNDWTVKIVER